MMKALSIRQPWAWLIVNGYKDIENRNWSTRYRGRLLIHAGKALDREGYRFVRSAFPDIRMPAEDVFPRGGIVGEATLADCVAESTSPWFFGRFGFVMADPEPLPFRPLAGKLSVFAVADDEAAHD